MFPLLVLIGCNSTSIYPPSKYIGLYENYNGYRNGSLPNHSDYTGIWENSNGRVTGYYRNGIPYGVWRSYYRNSILGSLMIYFDDGHYQRTDYYPDGLPRMASKGEYNFSGNVFSSSMHSVEFWDINGRLLNGIRSSSDHEIIPKQPSGIKYSLEDYAVESYYFIDKSNFTIAIYLVPENQDLAPYGKIIFYCDLDYSNKIMVKRKESSGSIDLNLAEYHISNQTVKLIFTARNLKEPRNKITMEFPLTR